MQKTVTDQMGREVTFNYPPKRIVSIVPSQTELLFDLGLDQEIVGITKFCIHPIEKFASKEKIGGTKKLLIEKIQALNPDLIIGNKEENLQSDIELLEREFPIWMSDIYNLEDATESISKIGDLVDRQPEAAYLNHLITTGFTDLQTLAAQNQIHKKAVYLIWKEPYMIAGKKTFINDVMTKVGLENLVKDLRYPQITLDELKTLNCELLLLSSEPYPFKQSDVAEIQSALPNTKILLVDGEMFSWHGSRLVKAVQYFFEFQKELI